MADTYASRDARRRAAMAEALMGGAMTAPQGGMVGRYYVGEGIGSGLTRIGQALLASRMGKQADEAENEYQAGQMAKRDAAMTGLINDITAPREETVQDFGNVAVTQNRKPSNQEIGAALLKYQNDTGMEVPKDLVGLLAPESGLGGGANKFQFGPAVITDIDGVPSFSVPTYDPSSRGVKVETAPIGGKVLNRNTGLSAQEQSALDVRTEGAKAGAKTSAELAFADQQAKAAAAKAAAEAAAKAKADRESEKAAVAADAVDALSELDKLESAIGSLPDTPVGMRWENFKAQFTGGDPKVQAAIGESKQIAGRMLRYVERLPGAATDKDREVFMASAGLINDDNAPPEQKKAAVRSARESFQRLVEKYGKPQAKPAATKTMKWNPATKRVE